MMRAMTAMHRSKTKPAMQATTIISVLVNSGGLYGGYVSVGKGVGGAGAGPVVVELPVVPAGAPFVAPVVAIEIALVVRTLKVVLSALSEVDEAKVLVVLVAAKDVLAELTADVDADAVVATVVEASWVLEAEVDAVVLVAEVDVDRLAEATCVVDTALEVVKDAAVVVSAVVDVLVLTEEARMVDVLASEVLELTLEVDAEVVAAAVVDVVAVVAATAWVVAWEVAAVVASCVVTSAELGCATARPSASNTAQT